jgi:pimeloyl-ACP methyl ester carboxylesterase
LEGASFQTFRGCSHYLHNERPEEFVRAVRAFLDDPTAPPTRFHPP